MAKIVVLEDDFTDLIRRYQALTKEHEVHVLFDGVAARYDPEYDRKIKARGFASVVEYLQDLPRDADVYFSDGRNGSGPSNLRFLIDILGIKGYLVSGDPYLRADAVRQDVPVAMESDIEKIVADTPRFSKPI